jgi:uncharacterized iron-regulated membrane protein
MSPAALRRWDWLHTWSSLVCTAFMLLLCVTGLPLIFKHELEHLLNDSIRPAALAADAARATLDEVVATGRAHANAMHLQLAVHDPEEPDFWKLTFGPTPTAIDGTATMAVDSRTAEYLGALRTDEGFLHIVYRLHVDLFAGVPGMLFLAAMGALLVLSIVSGAVLYGPFMKRLSFGTVRHTKPARVRWLDLHNLLGIVTLAWALVVGVTGVVNSLGETLLGVWRDEQLAEMFAPYRGQPVPTQQVPLEQAVHAAQAHHPELQLRFMTFPGTEFSSPVHWTLFMSGRDPLGGRLLHPVLIDVTTGKVTEGQPLPWYLKALLVSQPLHFGDYGRMPMQLLWALLDIATIIVLCSGLYLWASRRQTRRSVRQTSAREAARS